MNKENNRIDRHLTEDEILMALIDETDLGPGLRTHLSTCLQCSSEKKKLEQQLHKLGHMSEQIAPVPTRRIRLPETRDRFYSQRRWWSRPVLGMAAAMILVMILVWPQAKFFIQTYIEKDIMKQGIQQDNQLLAQVDVLVKDPLPVKYQDIIGADEADETEFDQDFMQYIVPPIKDNVSKPLSYSKKGVIS